MRLPYSCASVSWVQTDPLPPSDYFSGCSSKYAGDLPTGDGWLSDRADPAIQSWEHLSFEFVIRGENEGLDGTFQLA